jgi:N-acetylglucosaminyldiphosphoundecaprenol N-acetyl-beta-D-mannosaminyltransferase
MTSDGPPVSQFSVLGVRIRNVVRRQAIEQIEETIRRGDDRPASVFLVNAHTLNLAAVDAAYSDTLNAADLVFGDGVGVRWAARLQGIRMADNLAGTDLVPDMLKAAAGRGYSYFLLGADKATIARAADYARRTFPGWNLAGSHHGYLADEASDAAVVEAINAARPDVLLVGMGNPTQERWIERHVSGLHVRVCMGVGGLFDFWAGSVPRAPRWLRRLGHEWLWRLFQEPRRMARRYLVGNPLFLARILRERRGVERRDNREETP